MSTIINPERLGRRICSEAMRFNNLREIKPNARFDNPKTPGVDPEAAELLAMYHATGWVEVWSHCAAFVDAITCNALRLEGASPDQVEKFTRPMQLGVMNSVRAFQALKLLLVKPGSPLPSGSIWLARHGDTSRGHTGFVLSSVMGLNRPVLSTIEANTSKDAQAGEKDREGDWITTKIFPSNGRGNLVTQGFVTPEAICKLVNS